MVDFTPRPTTYKGIPMRSRLEAGFAAWLDQHRIDWKYEPGALADAHGQYLPDFVLTNVPFRQEGIDGRALVVEVKPTRGSLSTDRLAAMHRIVSANAAGVLIVVSPDAPPRVVTSAGELFTMTWVHHPSTDGPDVALAYPLTGPWPDGYWRTAP